MFVYNFKINGKKLFKIFFVVAILIAIGLFAYSTYKIFTNIKKESETFRVEDGIPTEEYPEIESSNYTNILKQVHDNIDDYIGQKISFVGYVYSVDGLESNRFVLARDMIINSSSQSVVVGFLCEYEDAKMLQDFSWVKIAGTIEKGDYFGEIPIIKIDYLENADVPDEEFVPLPDDTYVPTSVIY